jgi:hypothetical protein
MDLNTCMLKHESHEGPVLSPVCQKLLLESIMSVLNSLKHREHSLGHLLLNHCLTGLLGCQVSLLLSKGLEDRSKSRVNGRRGSRDNTRTPSLMFMWAWRHRRQRWNPKIIIIIIGNCCALSLKLMKSCILCLSVNHWIRCRHWILKGWTIRAKEEARGLKGALELWRPDQLSEDVKEIVSIGQLLPGTKTIQYGVLYLTNEEVNNIKL